MAEKFLCAERFPESLEMHKLPLAQEANGIPHIVVIRQPQDVVIGGACLLLCCQILCQIRDHISSRLKEAGCEGLPGSSNGVNARGVIHKIGVKAGTLDLLRCQIPCQLVYNCGNHFYMTEFFGTYIRQNAADLSIGHSITLAQIPQGRTQLAVRSAKLQKDIIETDASFSH